MNNIFVKANKLIRFIKISPFLSGQVWKFKKWDCLLRCVSVCLQKSEANRKKLIPGPMINSALVSCPWLNVVLRFDSFMQKIEIL